MINAADHAIAATGLTDVIMSQARSALPDAPVVADTPRTSLIARARRAVAATRGYFSRPAPALPAGPATGQA